MDQSTKVLGTLALDRRPPVVMLLFELQAALKQEVKLKGCYREAYEMKFLLATHLEEELQVQECKQSCLWYQRDYPGEEHSLDRYSFSLFAFSAYGSW